MSERNHPFFPLAVGSHHAPDCEACHPDPTTFSVFSCTGCHAGKPAFDLLHGGVPSYTYASAACYRCHPAPAPRPYGHAGITGSCALCHDAGQPFAALPVAGLTHRAVDGADCSGCHRTTGWRAVAAPPGLVRDPARDVAVTGLVPSWAGASIVAVTPAPQVLPMPMDHAAPALASATLADCAACHATTTGSSLYPGVLHAALDRLGLAQPATCAGCHAASAPAGFVGPVAAAPARAPASGEMRHDALEWADGAATTRAAFAADCGVCHASPSGVLAATWATGRSGAGRAAFHASLAAGGLPQPATCTGCHANGRPATLRGPGADALPAGLAFDHAAQGVLGDCAPCHGTQSAASGWTAWTGGRWHLAGSATPASCLPCHEGERPTSTAGWQSATYAARPFDYVTNAAGVSHGAGQDCAACHAGPGTGGAWGATQRWVGGTFDHGPATVAATTCVACHMSQRPDLQPGATAAGMAALLGFDHAVSGTGECLDCHRATVTAGRFASYLNPATGALPGGDWSGGVAHPGATLVFDPGAAFTVTALTLTRSGALVTGMTTRQAALVGAMSHESPAIPAAVGPGTAASPDPTGCWRCHASTGGRVTSYARGRFHAALDGYAATPGGAVTPLPQPSSGCADCHALSTPDGIVERAGSPLRPMDHAAVFASPVTIGGVQVAGVAGLDCSACHGSPGVTWADGLFHARIGAATPRDCTGCHYPLMASAEADVASGARYTMAHRSALVTDQRCEACHAGALARGAAAPVSAALWQPGAYHASVPAQPAACLECHPGTRPDAVLSSGTAALPPGVTFDHGAPAALGSCVTCHAAGGAWTGGRWHLAGSATPASCLPCHEGERPTSTAGWRSATYATAPFDYGTNAAGSTHGAGQDCAVCHAGPGTGAWGGTQTWVGGSFGHGPATIASATCITCHLSQRPDLQPGATAAGMAALLGFDHALNGTGDCFGCHQATVAAGRYASFVNPATGALPGGDWAGGASYPGATLILDPGAAFTVTALTLTRAGALVTGFTGRTERLAGAMSHVSAAIPAAISPGPAANPDLTGCWRCHTSTGGAVVSYANGRFHAALAGYRATPGGAVTPLPQPTRCRDCHASSTPGGIVEGAGSALRPMDHGAAFAAPALIGGVTVSGVEGLDCSACHLSPGVTWADGLFHASIAPATPQDCTACHYPLMATAAADVASGSRYTMRHRSAAISDQRCGGCHGSALARSTTIPALATLWQPGFFHSTVAAQPAACADCHAATAPAGVLTSGAAALPPGVTFDHGAPAALGDCAACHGAGGAWTGGRWHLAGSATPASCLPCHEGERPTSTAGWQSATYAARPFDYVTNAAGVSHGAGQDCAACHAGPGTGGAWGATQRWVGGTFDHGPATVAATTCIACHMSQRPDLQPGATAAGMAALLGFDHAASGAGECLDCHRATVTAGRFASYLNPATGALPGGDWSGGVFHPGAAPVFDPRAVYTVTALTLTRSGAVVTGFTARTAALHGVMSHVSPAIPAAVSPGPASSPVESACWHCHTSAGGRVTSYASGTFHAALAGFAPAPGGAVTPLPQPVTCADCHASSTPGGLVELAASTLRPMDHAAQFASPVTIGGVTVTGVPGLDCAVCHASPGGTWADGLFHARIGAATPQDCTVCHYPLMATAAADVASGTRYAMAHRSPAITDQRCDRCHPGALARSATTPVTATLWAPGALHPSLAAAALPQPAACLECHPATRPAGVLGSGTAGLPAGVTFDHGAQDALGSCATCHAAGAAANGWTAWTGGRWHLAGSATPASCLPCHEGERPTSTAGWQSATYTLSPFDYGTNAAGVTHGAGQDCALCHGGPGTGGAWGGTQRWVGGWFSHGPGTVAGTTCLTCHASQRPDLQPGATAAGMAALLGFDHAVSGTGDCYGCHQATVAAGSYVHYVSSVTGVLPGGDWAGGTGYPGATLVFDPGAVFTLVELRLTRAGGLVTGFTVQTDVLGGAMSHVSPAIPAEVSPGPASSPDLAGCWRCHTSSGGSVTSFTNGRFHAALDGYRATPGGPVTPLPQPASGCADCHGPSLPVDIVELAGSTLRPMDHAAQFAGPVTIGGVTVSGVPGLDCSVCHASPGGTWADGLFHARIGAATPQDCTVCHYPLMATAAADVTSGTRYAMAHRSPVITDQRCDACHAGALARSATAPVTAALWQPGAYHASVAPQPATCLGCHPTTRPTGVLSSGNATLPAGVTFDHGQPAVLGECATCHAAGGSWTGGRWHLAGAPAPGSCLPCHAGERPTSAAGWQSPTYAGRPFDYGTNAAGITHGAGQDCVLCHAGPGTGAWGGTQNWIGGTFAHGPATLAATTCSACHLSQRPDLQPGATAAGMAALLGFDHAVSGTGDCFHCHQATVAAGSYVHYVSSVTGTLPGGDWAGGAGYPGAALVFDPAATFTVTELTLTRSGGVVTGATARTATLHGVMSHVSPAIPAAIAPGPVENPDLPGCWRCHASTGGTVTSFANGAFHAALAGYRAAPGGAVTPLPQPVRCADCHGASTPSGIVELAGSSLRPMDHGALFVAPVTIGGVTAAGVAALDCATCHVSPGVAWADGLFHASVGAATPQDCSACHYPLMATAAADVASGTRFSMRHRSSAVTDQRCDGCHPAALARSGTAPVDPALWQPGFFHASVTAQPAGCLECHPGTRPAGVLTSANATLPAGLAFDHGAPGAVGDCATCHAAGGSWTGGRWHLAGAATPASCLPCHAGERPTSTAGWRSATYTRSPFDYGGNAGGATHGAGQDCVLCHAGPGTGAWGGTQNWIGGAFSHGPGSVADTTCSACHTSQRPDLQPGATAASMAALLGFDHAVDGTGDCLACHQATVTLGRYVDFVNPATGELPGGDWAGGAHYPGGALVFSPSSAFPVTELTLTRAGALVTGFTSRTATLVNPMSHLSPGIPPAMSPGPASSPDLSGCWRCHTSLGGRVISYAGGTFHTAVAGYRAAPGGAITPLPQPTGCGDCHGLSLPGGIVELGGSALQPMDHGALFATTVTIGGVAAGGVAGLDCAVCHVSPGVTWADGLFHARIGAATPRDCAACHYPLMASAAADVSSGTRYTMAHRSPVVTDQRCDLCHQTALARSATVPVAAALWQPGAYHASVPQPATCLDCHATTRPPVLTAQNSTLPAGVTFDHAGPGVGDGCATCHGAGTSWTGARFHRAGAVSPAACLPCHEGQRPVSTAGWQSPTWSVSPFDYVTNAAGVTHGGGQDCAVCHPGPGTGAWGGTQSWVGGAFTHGPTTVAGRTCVLCHRSQRPDLQPGVNPETVAALLGFDHAVNGQSDCFGCHQATVARGRFMSYFDPATGALPGGDWAGGTGYPGAVVVIDPGGSFTVSEISLVRSGATITGYTSRVGTHHSAMSHVSAAIPPELAPGPPASPDPTTCWRCHENDNGVIVAYANGAFHPSLNTYAPTPGANVVPLPQPTSGCGDCHVPSTPTDIVEGAGGHLEPMDHAARFASPVVLGTVSVARVADLDCSTCHVSPGDTWADGLFHPSLAALVDFASAVPVPADCAACHYPLMVSAAADVSSGARYTMAHRSRFVTDQRCEACHAFALDNSIVRPPSAILWRPGVYHAGVAAQPAGCLECHPGTRPAAVLTSATAVLPPGVTFDHGAAEARGECATCHLQGAAAGGFTAWTGGRWHLPGAAAPGSCLPCHAGERPTSDAGWQSATYAARPFDYGGNAAGVTHGAGQDCALCHPGPGTGAWGGTQTWLGGAFAHGAGTAAAETCISCHMSQRPDLQPGATAAAVAALLGFDHALDGTGDCFGCHQATVARGRYATYVSSTTGALPGGDWAGGVAYPGATLVYSLSSAFTVTEISLARTGSLVTGMTAQAATLHGAMSHVSPGIPAAMAPGPASSPDPSTCWRCHTSTGGTVTAYAGGRFHAALAGYAAIPGGAVTPLPQPAGGCAGCHPHAIPTGIVERAASALQPMDHAALFTAPVTIGGVTVTGVAGLDCSVCHVSPGVTWADGLFHARIGSAAPRDCAACHYPLMASSAADVASGTRYAMAHRSAVIADQRCEGCHAGALGRSATVPAAASLWQPGAYHASVPAQPAACRDCHAVSVPAVATQSPVVYALAGGGTATNGGQWMSHAAPGVAGADCAACHAADAPPAGGGWSRSTAFHAQVAQPVGCRACHGLANGNGAVPGAGNNLPSGIVDSATATTASADPLTGVPAGTRDRIDHADASVGSRDCGFCHAQAGPSTVPGVQGREWAQARFHASFSAADPLVTNGTTSRCSRCHLNVKPGPTFTRWDHAAFTDAFPTQDCGQCHLWPGTGTVTAPNWLGGGSSPLFITVGGFVVPSPPASTPTIQAGIPDLIHPDRSGGPCITCHAAGGAGGTGARGYDHASPLIATTCAACHETGSHLVGTVWNGATAPAAGAGDTRPITLTAASASYKGNTRVVAVASHFYLDRTGAQVDCGWCHVAPAGVAFATTGAAYLGAWAFTHPPELDPPVDVCYQCHLEGRPPRDAPGPGP